MKRSTIVNLNQYNVLEFLKKNRLLFLLCSVFIIGIVIGTVTFDKSAVAKNFAESSVKEYIKNRDGISFLSVMFSSFTASIILLLGMFLCGTSLMGMIMVPLLLAFRGFWYGIFASFLYSEYSLKGIAFNALIVIPPALIMFVCLLLASREAIGFSTVIAKLTLPKSCPASLCNDFKNYCGRFIFLSTIILISALIDAVMSIMFIKFFDF